MLACTRPAVTDWVFYVLVDPSLVSVDILLTAGMPRILQACRGCRGHYGIGLTAVPRLPCWLPCWLPCVVDILLTAGMPRILQQCRGHYSKKNIGLTAVPQAAVVSWILQQCRGIIGLTAVPRLPCWLQVDPAAMPRSL
jgi:hypothetical protein